jgi:hypothetical protein
MLGSASDDRHNGERRVHSIDAEDHRYLGTMTGILTDYEHQGDPLAQHTPTPAELRRQQQAEQMAEYIQQMVSAWPPLSDKQVTKIRNLLSSSAPTPPRDLMRWRVRLYCGHVAEKVSHRTHLTISSAFGGSCTCPNCGLTPATIIAAIPLGLASEATNSTSRRAAFETELAKTIRQADVAERRYRELNDRVVLLRQQLDATRSATEHGAAQFAAKAGATVMHRRGCRFVRNADETAKLSTPRVLEFTACQANEWLQQSTQRRRCKACCPDVG